MNSTLRLWLARLFIAVVFFFNVQCAVLFLFQPSSYAPSFEMSGTVGEGMLRGMGVLFLMWNVPYAFALYHPLRQRTSLLQAVIMQAIGVLGESLILAGLPAGHSQLTASILRFILFDAGGLLLLLAALLLARKAPMRPTT